MRKKIMLLIMIIPLIFMLTIFSVGKAASVVADIPVSGIRITTQNDDGIISVDMATYQNDIEIKAEVFPLNAKNRNYSLSVSGIGGEEPADVDVDSNGRLSVNGTGRVKVTVTSKENAFTDSVIVTVTSSKVFDLLPSVKNTFGESVSLIPAPESVNEYDYSATLSSGGYNFHAAVNPSNLASEVYWQSSANEVITINRSTGKAKAMLSGSAIVSVFNDDGVNGIIEKKIKLDVIMAETESGVTVNGAENGTVLCLKGSASVDLFVETANPDNLQLSGEGLTDIISYLVTPIIGEGNRYRVTFVFSPNQNADISIGFFTQTGSVNTVVLAFSDFIFEVYTVYHTTSEFDMYQKNGATVTYFADSEPHDEGVSYVWSTSDENVIKITEQKENFAKIHAVSAGTATVTVKAYRGNKLLGVELLKSVTVVQPLTALNFINNSTTYGISDLYTIGGYKISNKSYVKEYTDLPLKIQTSNGWSDYNGHKDVIFESSDTAVAEIYRTVSQIKADVKSTGKVAFTAKWKYADYFGESVSARLVFKAVADGVNVSNYADLYKAAEDGKSIVLNSDIMLGKQNASVSELRAMTKSMPTTFDWQFYENMGQGRPEVLYALEFKNDVYGNGYEINGDYIAKAEDSTGTPLIFKGPLNFVSIAMASVKAQDNIVFLARTKGITLDNVVLKGCKDESVIDKGTGEFDLSLLNHAGTTLEVGADVTIKNSRISNGRTVVRIYGGNASSNPVVTSPNGVIAEDERVNALIESCIITNAREFLLKIGSNRALLAKTENGFSLCKLPRENGINYEPFDSSNANDEYFKRKYLTTDVRLKNSVLATSGLFGIGMDAHFGGEMLSGSMGVENWYKLAATSYASALHLEGNVKLLDWKNLKAVDSSTLIETTGSIDGLHQYLKLDVAAMLNKVSKNSAYNDIVSVIEGEKYVHGGIAMYGGGYNYSYVDFTAMTAEALKQYNVNLSVLMQDEPQDSPLYAQGSMLPLAAGPSDFRFYMYNKNSVNDYVKQKEAIESGEAYKVPVAE